MHAFISGPVCRTKLILYLLLYTTTTSTTTSATITITSSNGQLHKLVARKPQQHCVGENDLLFKFAIIHTIGSSRRSSLFKYILIFKSCMA